MLTETDVHEAHRRLLRLSRLRSAVKASERGGFIRFATDDCNDLDLDGALLSRMLEVEIADHVAWLHDHGISPTPNTGE